MARRREVIKRTRRNLPTEEVRIESIADLIKFTAEVKRELAEKGSE